MFSPQPFLRKYLVPLKSLGPLVLVSIFISAFSVSPAHSAKRIAFVVGIDKYDNFDETRQLTRSVNDARAMKKEFVGLNYDVVGENDLRRSDFNKMWQQFLDKIEHDDTVAIFLSGHGIEINGENFILPRDIPFIEYGRQQRIKREAFSISELLEDLRDKSPKITLLILDACRENPFIPVEFRKGGKVEGGLARIEPSEGTFIMYSAAAGKTALDRLSNEDKVKNSVYVRALLPLMRQPNLNIVDLARTVRAKVIDIAKTANHRQRPAYYDELDGEFCLAGCQEGKLKNEISQITAPMPVSPKDDLPATIKEPDTINIDSNGIKEKPSHDISFRPYKGTLAKDEIKSFTFEGKQNSPIVILTPEPKDGLLYRLEILDKREKQLYKFDNIGYYKSKNYEHAFTPPDSGTYTLRLTGTVHHGKFKFSMEQVALSSDLIGKDNVVSIDDKINGKLAIGATAEYSFEGKQNSPIVILTPEPKDGLLYRLEILDKREKQLYKFDNIGYYKSKNYEHAFTPPDSGTYTLRLTGTAHHGKFNFSVFRKD